MKIIAVATALLLAGCVGEPCTPDYDLRHQRLLECMRAIPLGPERTHYNDLAEAMSICSSHAYYSTSRSCKENKNARND